MSISTAIQAPAGGTARKPLHLARRVPRLLWLVLAILVSWSVEIGFYRAFEPPGEALRHELQGAAGELGQEIVPQATPAMRAAIRRHFRESAVEIDMAGHWPNVAVSFGGVSRLACEAAVRQTSRIDGAVVVDLLGYRSADDCGERNRMTWLLMP